MCTVTFIPLGNNDFILTSNRDENPFRKTISPKSYIEDGVVLTYPKDKLAGGTWIGLSDKNRLICLLNGAFINHKRVLPYKKSRGVIVKELLKVSNAVEAIKFYDFNGVEPFTIVLIDWDKQNDLIAYELVWTGETKHFIKLQNNPKIWSSATLYNNKMKNQREQWFQSWLKTTKQITQDAIISLHKNDHLGSSEFSFKMKRANVETLSITSFIKTGDKTNLLYQDLLMSPVITSS